jgi:hypothetical protein
MLHYYLHENLSQLNPTKQVGLKGVASDFHLRGAQFKSLPGYQLSQLRFSWFSSVPPGKL